MNETILSDRMYKLRVERNLSYQRAADSIGASGTQWFNWENGINVPSARCIIAICREFNVSADWLLGLETTPC